MYVELLFLLFLSLVIYYHYYCKNRVELYTPLTFDVSETEETVSYDVDKVKQALIDTGFSATDAKKYIAKAKLHNPISDDAMVMWAYHLYAQDLGINDNSPDDFKGSDWSNGNEEMSRDYDPFS